MYLPPGEISPPFMHSVLPGTIVSSELEASEVELAALVADESVEEEFESAHEVKRSTDAKTTKSLRR
jgi:hypothetical protein